MPQTYSVVIIGAGLGGLAAAIAMRRQGHEVTVLEAAPQLGEIGAGIQMPPNCTRLWDRLGVYDRFDNVVTKTKFIQMRRWKNGQVIARTKLNPEIAVTYGYPSWGVYRPDYHRILIDYAMELGVHVRINCRVVSVKEGPDPKAVTSSGEEFSGDVIVGADGIKSVVRDCILGDDSPPLRINRNSVYRAQVPRADMLEGGDEDLDRLMNEEINNCWIGEDRHIMAYPIKNKQLYNMVMSHPGKGSTGNWNMPGDLNEMRSNYATWDPVLQKILLKVKACVKWSGADIPELKSWTDKSGTVILIGDAAHAMLQYLGQGAATAIEDGAALAEVLTLVPNKSELGTYIKMFEQIRKPRTTVMQALSSASGDVWHMPDGPEQQKRDQAMGKPKSDKVLDPNWKFDIEAKSPGLTDPDLQPWLYSYDAIEHIQDEIRARVKSLNNGTNGTNGTNSTK